MRLKLAAAMRPIRLLAFLWLAVASTSVRAQDTTSLRDTLAYTKAIVTIRAKPFANARALGLVQHRTGSARRLCPSRVSQSSTHAGRGAARARLRQLARRMGAVSKSNCERQPATRCLSTLP